MIFSIRQIIPKNTMRHAHRDLIEMKHTHADEDRNAEMLIPAGDTDLAADIHADRHRLHLLDGRLHGSDHRAIPHMSIRDDLLPLGSHDGRLEDLRKDIQKFPAKVHSDSADAILRQPFLQRILICPRLCLRHAERGSCDISTLVFFVNHLSFPVL